MSREIKFRAWSEESECYTCSTNITEQVYANAVVHPEGTGQFLLDNDVDYEFEQYTGLKDKNGVEIYEGDILKIHVNSTPINTFRNKVVVYAEASFNVKDAKSYSFLEWIHPHCIEILGNIHQHPELLGE